LAKSTNHEVAYWFIYNQLVRFDVSGVVLIKFFVSLDMTLCRLVDGYQCCFKGWI